MKVGFIGMGNMGQALAGGMISKFLVAKEDVLAYAPNYEKLCNNAEKYGFTPYKDLHQMIEKSDMIIMACKPYHVETVMPTIKDALKGKAVLSVIAGWPYDRYNEFLDESTRFQFVVPNTPAMVGEGVFILEEKTTFTDEEKAFVENIFEKLGIVLHIPSNRLDIANAIAGCGPAFIDLIIEAIGDAGVKYGLQRQDAYMIASKMIMGSAKLQYETGEHPGKLKDNVCSPNGLTIRGVDALEKAGLRSAFLSAIDAVMAYKV